MFTPDRPVNFQLPVLQNFCNAIVLNHLSQKIGRNTYQLHTKDDNFIFKSSLSAFQANSIALTLEHLLEVSTSPFSFPHFIDSMQVASNDHALLISYVEGNSIEDDDRMRSFDYILDCFTLFSLDSIVLSTPLLDLSPKHHFFESMYSDICLMIHSNVLFSSLLPYFSSGPPDKSPSLVHGDFIFQNMLWLDVPQPRLALIDWEFSGVYYKSFDYSWFLVMSCVYDLVDVSDLPNFSRGCPNEPFFLLFSFLRLLLRLSQVKNRSDIHSLQEVRFTIMLSRFLDLYGLPCLTY